MRTRTIVLIGLAALAAGWLAGSATAPRGTEGEAPAPRGPRPLGSARPAGPYAEQLRQRLQAQPAPPTPGRNPFVFGAGRALAVPRPRASRGEEPPALSPEPAPAPAPTPRPRFVLSGIAAELVAGSMVFTAVLTDNGVLTFVTEGLTLPGGYTAARVDEASVVLVDGEGREHVLRLK